MRILEKGLVFGILIALILKFSLVPGGDTLTLWTILILACIYHPLGFLFFNQIRLRHILKKTAYASVTATDIILAVVTGLGLSIVCVGLLFKLLDLTGGNQMFSLWSVLSPTTFAE